MTIYCIKIKYIKEVIVRMIEEEVNTPDVMRRFSEAWKLIS